MDDEWMGSWINGRINDGWVSRWMKGKGKIDGWMDR